ncbi:MAG: chromosome segregation protein [Gaiellaceae bacterium]|nr:chromosome segregation protein [Gaiellaceae bacterium]
MHLKAIKLRGFKSFVDPVEIQLESGVAVVVGPNGSGKSNVSDSILWATGSMSPGELRAEKPDDVLFAGSTTGRNPSDFCEVDLLFDNSDSAWPDLPYSEVSICRRLTRGGEGQYLVNKTPVRRIDVVELLSDVGLGGGLRSVISQGRVETVLNSKPSERRELIEEAAGLGRFKRRRHRAELKLARVGIQVERARDLEDEVKKRLRPLALQATAAERAEKLGVEIGRLQAAIATLDLARLAERRTEAEARRAATAEERRLLEEKINALVAERERAEEELTDSAGAREQATAALYRLRSGGERIVLRRESAASLTASIRSELEAARSYDPSASVEMEAAARDASTAAQAAAGERARLQVEAEARWARVAAIERDAQSSLAAELDAVLERRAETESHLTGGSRDALLALRGATQRLGVRHESAQRLLAELRLELVEARHAPAGPTPAELGRAADESDAAVRTAAREREDLEARVRLARERLTTLEQSLAEREGLPPAARALAEAGEQLVLQLLEVEAGAERSTAAALGHLAAAVLAANPERGLELVEQAQASGLGSVLVLVGRDPLELVQVPVVERDALLASTVPAVTKEGIGWDPARGELWFAGETAEAVLLELDARRRELEAEVAQLAERADQAARTVEEAAERARAAAEAFAPVAHLRNVRRADPARLERLVAGAESLDETLRVAAAAAGRLEAPLAERTGRLAEELRGIATREAELRRSVTDADARARAAEARANGRTAEASGSVDELRLEAEDLSARAAEAAKAADDTAERARTAARALADADPGRTRRPTELVLESLLAGSTRLEAALAVDVDRFEAPVRERAEAQAARTTQLGASLRTLGAAEVELRQTAGVAGEKLSAIDVELARTDAEREEAQRRLDASDSEPAVVENSEGANRDELAEKLARYEKRREQLGQVNPLAKEEYDAEKVRLEELSVQRADLEKSLAELEKLRDDLTKTVETRFAETFEAVEKHFHEVAATLFPGGEGRLKLTEAEEEGDEPGIEVELRPAGKRVTRLSLLSGGEKALGAIAFLFSLFLARPSPFYLLDEVEAALDDTNIGRFTELLRTYADRAQFIVITHQKRTMEAADVLYGVTMGNDGVSQIVSRRLPRDEEVAATA